MGRNLISKTRKVFDETRARGVHCSPILSRFLKLNGFLKLNAQSGQGRPQSRIMMDNNAQKRRSFFELLLRRERGSWNGIPAHTQTQGSHTSAKPYQKSGAESAP
jgi:hypothetical protein